ncbi:21960_t:CDS:1 [Gigaspora margarita]|uniref:21960_t:CDS:1 n=1 Tax=Gigaspora margarita TaxID=4874 RepID=A0ABN7V7Q7_GIGMA|nr:21960_t:CDS:1 [Gigaspora margarita]
MTMSLTVYLGHQEGVDMTVLTGILKYFQDYQKEKDYDSNRNLTRIKIYVTNKVKLILTGFCPNNRSNERGKLNSNCPAIDFNGLSNKQRTKLNIKFSKGVIVFTENGIMDSGTIYTESFATKLQRYLYKINLCDIGSCDDLIRWFVKYNINSFTIGGSRKSFSENIVSLAEKFIIRFIPKLHNSLKCNHEFIKLKPISTFYVLGPPGSFSHELAQEICETLNIDLETIKFQSNYTKILESSYNLGNTECVLVPIKHDNEFLYDYPHSFVQLKFTITKQTNYYLLSNSNKRDITHIHSHLAGLKDCDEWIKKNYPNVSRERNDSTSNAARIVSKSPGLASISSKLCIDLYNLNCIEEIDESHITKYLFLSNVIFDYNDKIFYLFNRPEKIT